jgi:uncharacterized protein YjbI with pentapeptide repeats
MVSVTEAGLSEILSEHETWIETNADSGSQADFSQLTNLQSVNFTGLDLSGARFDGVDLSYCVFENSTLKEADFDGAKLPQVNLSGANLNRAILHGADVTKAEFCGNAGDATLFGADLRDATLVNADLSTVNGLSTKALAGADLTLAKLPPDIAAFKGLEHVSDISRHARTNFFAVIVACVYCWLTIATTTDVALLLNSSSTPLPIIQTAVPLAGFYWAAPILLLALYIYLHLYLQRMWESLAALPAVFPDGRGLDEHAYPWLLTGLVRACFPKLMTSRSPMSALQNAVSIFFAWCLVPLTVGLFWWRYLPRHDWWGSAFHIAVFVVACTFAWISYRLAIETLKNRNPLDQPSPPLWQYYLSGTRAKPGRWRGPTVSVWIVMPFLVLTSVAVEAPKTGIDVIDDALSHLGARADLFEVEITDKPATWVRGNPYNTLPQRVRLSGSDLRNANAERTFFANADLRDADLFNATLENADLQSATLASANLRNADLDGVSLVNANLWLADARGARLNGADLRYAHLRGVRFFGASLEGAHLFGADLADAELRTARLNTANLSSARLQGTDLRKANLNGARLVNAVLTGARLQGAALKDADISGADFTGAKIHQNQLNAACGTRAPLLSPEDNLSFRDRPCPRKPSS